MSYDINPDHPLASLKANGCTVSKVETTTTTNFHVGGMDVASDATYGATYEIGLPQQLTVEATFSPEDLGKQFLKIFTGELQTGDEAFDPVVFIATKDESRTASFLENDYVRNAILDIVSDGGTVALAGTRATFAFTTEPDKAGLAAMARVLVAAT